MNIAILTRKYESNGNPGCVSSGMGDLGGISYGLYQFASNLYVVDDFVKWAMNYPDKALANYGNVLNQFTVNSNNFINTWKQIGLVDPQGFGKLQDDYIIEKYYNVVAKMLKTKYFDLDTHSLTLKNVVLSRAIQNGPSGCSSLFSIICEDYFEYPNLSYIDAISFDKDIITYIYNFLIDECDGAYWDDSKGYYQSPDRFCHGSWSIIKGLRNRFVNEKQDALALYKKEDI